MQSLLLKRGVPTSCFRTSRPSPQVVIHRGLVVTEASTKLYVGNLAWSTTQDDLVEHFGQFGNVEDAFVATDRESGRSRGFGFVTMESEAASNAIQQSDNADFMGRNIRVNEAQPRADRPERTERRSYNDSPRGRFSGSRGGSREFGSRSGGSSYGRRNMDE